MEQDVNINRYIFKFSIAYFVGIIALAVILHVFELEHNSGASIAVLIGAAMYCVGKFIEENKRIPNKSEKSKMIWFSLLASWLISIIQLFIIVLIVDGAPILAELSSLIEKLNITIITGIVIFVSLIYFAILSWSYGSLAEKQLVALQKKGKI